MKLSADGRVAYDWPGLTMSDPAGRMGGMEDELKAHAGHGLDAEYEHEFENIIGPCENQDGAYLGECSCGYTAWAWTKSGVRWRMALHCNPFGEES